MAVRTVGEYLSALEKSKLLTSEQLVKARRLASESSDAAGLAKAMVRENLVSRWQAGTLLALGQRAQLRLGKYKLIQRLGKGGMGTVFLAEHVTMNRRVALKIVPRAIAEDRASLDRFFAEAAAIAALDHPNIVQAYSVDNEMDRYFIVMEFVDGQDLQRLVEVNGPMDFEHASDYIRQAADGLAHAHARNLVHCDIKPSNLLVNPQGVLKILDLGLARLNRSDEPQGAAAGEPAFGTVDYMAPEQAMQTSNFDDRADIYSLGCTLYFLLTGHPPFPEGTLAQRIVRHQTQEPRDILLERPDTPPKLVAICKRMMAKDPEDRYPAMQEVSAALGPRQAELNGAPPARGPQLVKTLEEAPLVAAGAEDWISLLAAPSKAGATSGGSKTVAATAVKSGGIKTVAASAAIQAGPIKSGKQPGKKGKTAASAAATAGAWALLPWFNTMPRKVAGIAGGIASLAAAAGVASWLMLSNSQPALQTVQKPALTETKTAVEEDVNPPPDNFPGKKPEKKPDASPETHEKNAPNRLADVPKPPKHSAEKPKIVASPKPPDIVKPITKPDVPRETKDDAILAMKPVEPAPKPSPRAVEAPKDVSLTGLATVVDLPLPGKSGSDAFSLGKAEIDPSLAVDIELLGGDKILNGNPTIELKKVGEETAREWSIQMTEKGKGPVKIARIWQDEDEFKFQWSAVAREKASQLRYCGLQFSCKGKSHYIALNTVKIVPPLVINFESGYVKVPLSRDFPLPDLSLLRLKIEPWDKKEMERDFRGLDSDIKVLEAKSPAGRPQRGKVPELVPGETLSLPGYARVMLTKDRTPHVAFKISFISKGKDLLHLEMQALCEISHEWVSCDDRSLQFRFAEASAFVDINTNNHDKNFHPAPGEQIDAAKKVKEDLNALRELALKLNKKTSISYRVYAVVGGTAHDVEIFRSGSPETPIPGLKQAAKPNKAPGKAAPEEDLRLP